jgi:hypothetical protein
MQEEDLSFLSDEYKAILEQTDRITVRRCKLDR